MELGMGPGVVVYIIQMSSLEVELISFWALLMATEFLFLSKIHIDILQYLVTFP